jgi:hypothetical protein
MLSLLKFFDWPGLRMRLVGVLVDVDLLLPTSLKLVLLMKKREKRKNPRKRKFCRIAGLS